MHATAFIEAVAPSDRVALSRRRAREPVRWRLAGVKRKERFFKLEIAGYHSGFIIKGRKWWRSG